MLPPRHPFPSSSPPITTPPASTTLWRAPPAPRPPPVATPPHLHRPPLSLEHLFSVAPVATIRLVSPRDCIASFCWHIASLLLPRVLFRWGGGDVVLADDSLVDRGGEHCPVHFADVNVRGGPDGMSLFFSCAAGHLLRVSGVLLCRFSPLAFCFVFPSLLSHVSRPARSPTQRSRWGLSVAGLVL